ncbi:TPA: DUF551 domain-containing protein [Salmonella enterica]
MTTITKEWLQQTIAEFENTRDDIPFGLSDDDAKILIVLKRALASLDAEPVGYFYADKPGDWYQISDGDRVPGHRLIPLYASPQSSPAVKLPNEFISSEGIVVQIEKLMAVLAVHGIQYERKGSSCRVDILQAGNSPVIPDGWISCSERMPAQDDWVLLYSKYGEYLAGQVQGEYVELNDGTLSWLGAALHWMPLPEPPQEVNRG